MDALTKDPPATLRGQLRFVGPSLILTATLVGSGELIITTIFGAKLGFVALWVIVASCVLKVAMQDAMGRYTISSGKTALEAIDSLPGPRWLAGWGVWFWLAVILLLTAQAGGIAMVVGEALSLLFERHAGFLGEVSPRDWAPVVCIAAAVLLYSGRYRVIEYVSVIAVCLFSVSIIVCSLLIQSTPYAISAVEVSEGFQFKLPDAGLGMTLALVGAVGLSSTDFINYPHWCLEKGYARFAGPNEPTPEWEARAKGWIRVMQLDCYVALVIYTTTTIAFYLLGAAILHRQGDVPEGFAVVRTLSKMYTDTIGPGAYYLFVLAAIVVLFSTTFGSIAINARLMPDCLNLIGVLRANDDRSRHRWVKRFVIIFATLYAVTSQVDANPVRLIVLGLSGLALMFPMICFAALYFRYRKLDVRLKPSLPLDIWLWVSSVSMAVFTLIVAYSEIGKLLTPSIGE